VFIQYLRGFGCFGGALSVSLVQPSNALNSAYVGTFSA
jgi:hypothetical protein